MAVDAGVLAALAWTPLGTSLDPDGLVWWMRTPLYAAIAVIAVAVARTPLAWWFGFVRERRWQFSTQRLSGWTADRAKAVAIEAPLTAAALLGLVAVARKLPGWWVVPAAVTAALLALLLSFVAPVVLEPIFNRFSPLDDENLNRALRALAQRSEVPVREVLVQDASRRTRKGNAYVSGLGRTRRVVVADTLLDQATVAEVCVVVAHELGHRRHRHVLLGTALAMIFSAGATVVVWALLGTTVADPHRLSLVLLIGLGMSLISLPLRSAISRSWERTADRFALRATGDADAYRQTMLTLARSNLSDVEPPRVVYFLLFTHPTPAERIAAANA